MRTLATSAQDKLKEGQNFYFSDPAEFSSAVSSFREVTRLAPDWAEGYSWLATALVQQSKFTEAEPCFRRAIALEPSDPRHYLNFGVSLDGAGRWDEAARFFRDGLALKPHYGESDSRMMLAGVLVKLGRIDEAIAEWRTVASMEPMYPSYDEPIIGAKIELKNRGILA